MKVTLKLVMLGAVLVLAACSSEKVDVMKSPCVGLDNSPCGAKRPMNGNANQQS